VLTIIIIIIITIIIGGGWVVAGSRCVNLRTLVVTGGASVTNDGLKCLAERATQLTVSSDIATVRLSVCLSVTRVHSAM